MDKGKNYAALYGPGPPTKEEQEEHGLSGKTLSRYGFKTEQEAWDYASAHWHTPDCIQCSSKWLVVEADEETMRLIDANEL